MPLVLYWNTGFGAPIVY